MASLSDASCLIFGCGVRCKWQNKKKRCLHDMQELTHVEVKDEQGDTVGHEFILVCKKCGKVRKVRI